MERPTLNNTPMNVARMAFVLIAIFLGAFVAVGYQAPWWMGSLGGAVFGAITAAIDMGLKNFSVRGFSHATIGILVGVLCAWLITRVGVFRTKGLDEYQGVQSVFELMIYLALGFIGMMLALRSNREEFSLLIPYVRFRQDAVRDQPLLVDAPVIIDGRIPRLCATGFLSGALVVPRFVINELHHLANSKDEERQRRGKRGLECLSELQKSPDLEVSIHEDIHPDELVSETKLVALARVLGARILTNDINLGKVARLQNIAVLNLNELAKSMRPVVTPGDRLTLTIVKEGKDEHQGVGYLDDGTMIVVNQGKDLIGTTQNVVVAGSVQTSAGRLIFADVEEAPSKRSSKSKARVE